jgi:hypothetical protein
MEAYNITVARAQAMRTAGDTGEGPDTDMP